MTGVGGLYSEDILVEQPAIALFEKLGWQTVKCFHEFGSSFYSLDDECRSGKPHSLWTFDGCMFDLCYTIFNILLYFSAFFC